MSSTGPRLKIIRRLGTPLPGLTRKDPGDSSFPPGQHGPSGKRRKVSEYAKLLAEKQKVRFNYGISERQLRTILLQASRMEGRTGDNVLVLLERRLDNVVFRLGYAATIPAARQLVSHGHIVVNGRRVDRPSMRVKRGDEIKVGASARAIPNVVEQAERGPVVRLPEWLAHDPDEIFSARALGDPRAADAPFLVNAKALVEFYAR